MSAEIIPVILISLVFVWVIYLAYRLRTGRTHLKNFLWVMNTSAIDEEKIPKLSKTISWIWTFIALAGLIYFPLILVAYPAQNEIEAITRIMAFVGFGFLSGLVLYAVFRYYSRF